MSLRLTILGKSPSWQDRDGACSGYLVEAAGLRLLVDCGNGVFAKLRRHGAYEDVNAVLISHLHADHILDLVPFAYALKYGPALVPDRPHLHAPSGARVALRRLCGAWGSETLIEDAFELREYDPSQGLALGDVDVRFRRVPHYVPSHALELAVRGEPRRLVFSSDCGPNDALVEFAHQAALLLIEATLLVADAQAEPAGHLTAAQAGAIGRRADAGRLVLTHFSDQLDRTRIQAEAEGAFGRTVDLAAEGESYAI